MRIINDSDTVEFIDGSGDKLILLDAPRQRDLEACEAVERKAAFAQLETIKALGIDTDKAIAEAQAEAPAVLQAATDAVRSTVDAAPDVRAFRLKALAIKLIVGGEALGGQAIADTYGKLDAASAAWIDEKVAQVWDSAIPSDDDTRGTGADAEVPQRPAVEPAP